jgi:hypothetical protein
VEEGLKEMEEEMEEEGERNSILGGVENLGMEDFTERDVRNGKRCMYLCV